MAKKEKKKKYVKLGEKAHGFADPWSRFNIAGEQVLELETLNQRRSNKIKQALRGGHLQEASEREFEEYQESLKKMTTKKVETIPTPEEVLKEELEEKTKAELLKYYQDNYEVNEDEVKSFDKLNHGERVDELVELADLNPTSDPDDDDD